MPLAIWVVAGNIAVAPRTERLAHRHRIKSMGRYCTYVLESPLSFHGGTHSGRLIKGMLLRTGGLFICLVPFHTRILFSDERMIDSMGLTPPKNPSLEPG